MRVILLTSGSRGDVQPFIILGAHLKEKGYRICVAGPENYSEEAKANGLEFSSIHADTSLVMNRDEITSQLKARNPLSVIRSFRRMTKAFRTEFDEIQENAWKSCQSADALIYHPGMINGYLIAQELEIPSVLASPIPFSPTKYFPSLLFYSGPRLGSMYNRLTHRLFVNFFWSSLKASVKDFWLKNNKSNSPIDNPIRLIHKNKDPILYAFSKHVIPPPQDWDHHIAVTGYLLPINNPVWEPPSSLIDFLSAGSPPVYIGFGSTQGTQSADMLNRMITALRAIGQRIILSSKSTDSLFNSDSDILILSKVPHTWLFPQMNAVIHHGGAGTIAAGLQAGIPSIIIPQSNDQPMWGRRIEQLGVGISIKGKHAERNSVKDFEQIFSQIRSPEITKAAKEIRQRILDEDGIKNAIACIDRYLKDPSTKETFRQPISEINHKSEP